MSPEITIRFVPALVRVLFFVALLLAVQPVFAAEEMTVAVGNNEEVPIQRYPSTGDTVIIWTPSDFGVQPPQVAVATGLAKRGIEVWIADLHSAYFAAPGRYSSNKFPVADIGMLVDAAVAKGKQKVILASSGRATRLILRGARQWQLDHPGKSSIRGFILFSPSLYLDRPRLGEDADYLPIVSSTNLPIYIFQPLRSTTYLRLPRLRATLAKGGAQVFVHPLPDVAFGFHLRPDEDISVEDKNAREQLPVTMTKAVQLLTMQPPVTQATREPEKPAISMKRPGELGLKKFEKPITAPAFSLENLSGQKVSMSDYRGKVVLVNFWASWCPPCLEEMPSMERLYRHLKDQPFEILAIDVGEPKADVVKFVKTMKTTFPVLLDRDGDALQQWKVYVYPTNFIVDKQGRVRYGSPGAINWDEAAHRTNIKKLLKE
jgi:peroxiredoxin